MGYEVLELNASDARSKKLLESNLSDVTQNTVLSFGKPAGVKKKKVKRLIVMDEVDGMSSGDRGGMAALIAVSIQSDAVSKCSCYYC